MQFADDATVHVHNDSIDDATVYVHNDSIDDTTVYCGIIMVAPWFDSNKLTLNNNNDFY